MEGKGSHSPDWNLHCGEMSDAPGLDTLIEGYDLTLKNEPGQATRLIRRSKNSIIDRTFASLEVGALNTWITKEELSRPSHHGVITFNLAGLGDMVREIGTSQEVTEWNVKGISRRARKETSSDWHRAVAEQPQMGVVSSKDDI